MYNDTNGLVGHNRIEKILQGCAIMEHWTGIKGGEGKSLFYVDNDSWEWRQIRVTGLAKQPWGQKEKTLLSANPDLHQKSDSTQLLITITYLF